MSYQVKLLVPEIHLIESLIKGVPAMDFSQTTQAITKNTGYSLYLDINALLIVYVIKPVDMELVPN